MIDGDGEGLCAVLQALHSPRSRVLTTSRRALPSGIDYWPFEIGRLSDSATLAMFVEFAPPREKWGDSEDADEHLRAILKILDGYPFPIRLAATYMRQTRCSLAELRQSLEEDTLQTLAYPLEPENRNTSSSLQK